MATRIINATGAQMSITNRSATPLVAGPVFLQSGQSRSFPLRYVTNSWSYPESLATLLRLGLISVSFDNPDMGYRALGITDPTYFDTLAAPSALSLGKVDVYAAADLPDPESVPEGFTVFTTDAVPPALQTAIGAAGARAWV